MDWQFLLTCVTIAAAAGFVVWRGVKALRSLRGGCSGGCGCSKSSQETKSPKTLIAPDELTLRK